MRKAILPCTFMLMLVLAAASAWAQEEGPPGGGPIAIEPEISSYGFGVVQTHTQTSASGPVANSLPYVFQAFVNAGTGSASEGYLTAPDLEMYSLGTHPDHLFGISYLSPGYASLTALQTVFSSSGTYALNFVTPNSAPNGYNISSFELGAPDFPLSVPQIVGGGIWSGASFVFDVMEEDGQIEINGFTGMVGGLDVIVLSIYSETDHRASRSWIQTPTTAIGLGGPDEHGVPYFVPGDSYRALLTYIKVVDGNMGEFVPGANGFAFYATQTEFTFTAIPEPSTYLLMALGVGVVLIPVLRRRRRR